MPLITGTASPDILNGTVGADTIQGLGSDDILHGFDGDDILQGGDGDDLLYGGSGNDLMQGGAGEDLFYGLSGNDTASYATSAALVLDLALPSNSTGDAAGDSFLSVEVFVLTGFDDRLNGSSLGDSVLGGDGNDTLYGGGGVDTLLGNAGNDTFFSGAGADVLNGGSGFDTASYQNATSAVRFDLFQPELATGDAFGDQLISVEQIIMSDFADTVLLDGTARQVLGGAGNDSLIGAAGDDTLYGGQGDDFLNGFEGRNVLDGGQGSDILRAGRSADVLYGGAMDEVGAIDTVFYLNRVRLDLGTPANNSGDAKGDIVQFIEVFELGGDFSVFVGGAVDVTISTSGSNITCLAGAGAEVFDLHGSDNAVSYERAASGVTLIAATATSRLEGQRGAAGDTLISVDRLTLSQFSDVLTLTGMSVAVPQTILAGNGNDQLTMGGSHAVLIDLGGGRDAISGNLTGGRVTGGTGNDTIGISFVGIGSGDMTVSGGAGTDQITLGGYGGNDVSGGDGADVITINGDGIGHATVSGGSGDDVISGIGTLFDIDAGSGNDQIDLTVLNLTGSVVAVEGGIGNDTVTVTLTVTQGNQGLGLFNGGLGDDHFILVDSAAHDLHSVFQVDAAWGQDSITGFADGLDRIEFRATGATEFGHLGVDGDATHTVVTYGTDSIDIIGLDVALFTADDVLFT